MSTDAYEADVVVVGGGVIGLTTAIVLAERGRRVRVWAKEPSEQTTSAVAGALCWPYHIEPAELVGAWAVRSLQEYEALAGDPGATGVRRVAGVQADTPLDFMPVWTEALPGAREATADELPEGYGQGLRATVPLIDMRAHLGYLTRRLLAAGGAVEARAVSGFDEAARVAPVVVNCSGLGARELVPDASVEPVRGQLVVVENPGIEEWFAAPNSPTEITYMLPQPFGVVLGGTSQPGSWDRTADPATARAIVERCARVHPALAKARVLEHRVGLRPVRPAVRIEREVLVGGGVLVHNYGHGGAGVTVAWGCAEAAAELA
ncbi:FAD-dependent oxidoreductase [Streptomyces sp. NBC_01304]|uniref:FAD-dependent oxidoreductase n=1 Tax=Streptomyces sp. NBC_01304 TaxID=2903818 RepID=UPI002E0F2B3B|nr:FAD-binding oxidoreductase [Streptomyces sp. NBC_01304]